MRTTSLPPHPTACPNSSDPSTPLAPPSPLPLGPVALPYDSATGQGQCGCSLFWCILCPCARTSSSRGACKPTTLVEPPLHLLCPSRIHAALRDGKKDIITPLSSLSIHGPQLQVGLSWSWGLTTPPGATYSAPWAGGDWLSSSDLNSQTPASHPHPRMLLPPASLKGWGQIPRPLQPGSAATPAACRHTRLCPGSPPARAQPQQVPPSCLRRRQLPETELLTFHSKLRPSSSQQRATPPF